MRTTPSVATPRRRLLSSSSVSVTTRLGNSCFNPFTSPRRSLSCPCQPYSFCISKTSDTASPCRTNPASSIRARKVLPEPEAPNTPTERPARLPKSSGMDAPSIPCGVPSIKADAAPAPGARNTASISDCDAANTGAKCSGIVRAVSARTPDADADADTAAAPAPLPIPIPTPPPSIGAVIPGITDNCP